MKANYALASIYVAQTLLRIKNKNKDRLTYGMNQRKAMAAQLAAGITPTGPRAVFLDDVSSDIIHLMAAAAEDYNEENPMDVISANDMLDAIATCRAKLLAGIKRSHAEGVEDEDPTPQ